MENKNYEIRYFTPEEAIENKVEFVKEMIRLLEHGITNVRPRASECMCHCAGIILNHFDCREKGTLTPITLKSSEIH